MEQRPKQQIGGMEQRPKQQMIPQEQGEHMPINQQGLKALPKLCRSPTPKIDADRKRSLAPTNQQQQKIQNPDPTLC
jgi:hypothetical protein